MQFYNKRNLKRLKKSEEIPVKHSCLFDDDLGVFLLISDRQEEELKDEFCESELDIFASEDYIPSRKRSNAISEHIRKDRYKGKPTGYHLTLNALSSERIRQVLLTKP